MRKKVVIILSMAIFSFGAISLFGRLSASKSRPLVTTTPTVSPCSTLEVLELSDPTGDWKTYTVPRLSDANTSLRLTSDNYIRYKVKYPPDWYLNEPSCSRPHPSEPRLTTYRVSPDNEPFDRDSEYGQIHFVIWGDIPPNTSLAENPEIQDLKSKGYDIRQISVSGIKGVRATFFEETRTDSVAELVYLPVNGKILRASCLSSGTSRQGQEYLRIFHLMLRSLQFID